MKYHHWIVWTERCCMLGYNPGIILEILTIPKIYKNLQLHFLHSEKTPQNPISMLQITDRDIAEFCELMRFDGEAQV